MKKLLTFLFGISLLFCAPAELRADNAREIVETFDLRFYNPKNFGLKDLVFEVRVTNLTKLLSKSLTLKNLSDVHFKVYWLFPGKYNIQVMGMPEGYPQIEKELKGIIKNRLDFVIPEKLGPKLRSYKLKKSQVNGKHFIKATDPSHSRAINEMHLVFNKDGQLRKMKTFSPSGVSIATMRMSPKGWSHNKWAIDYMTVKTILGVQTTKLIYDVDYTNVGGYGLPSKIKTTLEQELLNNSDVKGEKGKRSVESTITFQNYKVNTGEAKKRMVKAPNDNK